MKKEPLKFYGWKTNLLIIQNLLLILRLHILINHFKKLLKIKKNCQTFDDNIFNFQYFFKKKIAGIVI